MIRNIVSYETLKNKNSDLRAAVTRREALERDLVSCPRRERAETKEKLKTAREREDKLFGELSVLQAHLQHTGGIGGYAETPNETPLIVAECIGHAYGYAVYVDSYRNIRVDKTEEQSVRVGDIYPDDIEDCLLLSALERGEQDIILRYLCSKEETPAWFKGRFA